MHENHELAKVVTPYHLKSKMCCGRMISCVAMPIKTTICVKNLIKSENTPISPYAEVSLQTGFELMTSSRLPHHHNHSSGPISRLHKTLNSRHVENHRHNGIFGFYNFVKSLHK